MAYFSMFQAVVLVLAAWNPGKDWQSNVTDRSPGDFPAPEPVTLRYVFSWSGIQAGQAKVKFNTTGNAFVATAEGGTIGMARSLWQFDMHHRGKTDPDTLKPLGYEQNETLRTKKNQYTATFSPKFVEASKVEKSGEKSEESTKKFRFKGTTFDLLSAYLYLRSFPWQKGDAANVVLFPVYSPYLLHVEAVGREKVTVGAGEFDAIRFRLDVKKIVKKKGLEDFKRFKSATVWISDDPNRYLLKVDTELFVGTVRAELARVEK